MPKAKYEAMDYVRAVIRYECKRRGVTQTRLAGQIGWADSNFSRWLNSRRPNLAQVERVASSLGYDFIEFLQLGRKLTVQQERLSA